MTEYFDANIGEAYLESDEESAKTDKVYNVNIIESLKIENAKLLSEKKFLDNILEMVYDGLIIVDKDGYITKISEAYLCFLGLKGQNVVGRHVTDIIENTHMHIVASTGIAETNALQKINNNYIVATRLPFYKNGEVAGVIGKVLFRDTSEIQAISKKLEQVQNELSTYKREVVASHHSKYDATNILTRNKEMLRIKSNLKKIGRSGANAVITGESGTGKELFAHAIHAHSKRASEPFVAVNCAAIPENLLESELFGYEKGAFTGATTTKVGKFEVADGGTLFLDEIGDMPLQMQAKILRTIQEGEVERIGGSETKSVDVRIISATNRDLKEMIKNKTFREDLYYRLNVFNISVPPLRERKEDIELICDYLVDNMNHKIHKNVKGLSKMSRSVFLSYGWPGNVREPKNVVERAYYILEYEEYIEPWHLPVALRDFKAEKTNTPLRSMLDEYERKLIIERLAYFRGNKTKTADALGISRMALHTKIQKLKI